MSNTPWIKWYSGDFLNGIADLTPHEIALYTVILCRIYDEDRAIPHDLKKLARRCNMRLPQCEAALESLLGEGKLILVGGCIDNKRASKERENRQKTSAKQSVNASSRWQDGAKKPNKNNGRSKPPHESGNAKPMPTRTRTRSQKPEKKHIDAEHDEHFGIWWLQYPRKLNKAAARKAYPGAVKKSSHVELLAAIMRLGPAMARGDPSFIPHPATWLNGERWHDDESSINPESRPVENRGGSSNVVASVRRFVASRSA
jgi:uncharacterized protein YdaU (DUF1376 family)